MKNSDKINICSGKDIKQNYVNLDSVKIPGVDVVHDLNKYPYPFEDNQFNEIVRFCCAKLFPQKINRSEETHNN